MGQRGVSDAAVSWVLANFDLARPAPTRGSAPPTTIYGGIFEGREVRVYVDDGTRPLT